MDHDTPKGAPTDKPTSAPITVRDPDGAEGIVRATLPEQGKVVVQFGDERLVLEAALLEPEQDGHYRFPYRLRDLTGETQDTTGATQDSHAQDNHEDSHEAMTVALLEETLRVAKHRRETGRVVVQKVVTTRTEEVDEPLLRESVDVKRVVVNRVVSETIPARQEGDTTIVPLYEEVLVVEKRLMLREELHISRRAETHHDPQQVSLRQEDAVVRRLTAEELASETQGS